MGFQVEFNWMLKVADLDETALCIQKTYPFFKSGLRVYPIDIPIDLVNGNWEAVGRCFISDVSLNSEGTNGHYTVIEIYDKSKRDFLTNYWRSLLMITKGLSSVDDFSKLHIT